MNTRTFASCLGTLSLFGFLTACGGGSSAPSTDVTAPSAAVTASIGAAGGTLTGPDGVQVVIPAGALDQPTTIGIARSSAGAPTNFPEGITPAGSIYEFTPHDVIFDVPVTIRMPVPANAANAEALMASPGGDWQVQEATVTGNVAEWQRNSFSWGLYGYACHPTNSAPYSDSNPDPYPCWFGPSGGTNASATPASAITRTASAWPSDYTGTAGSWTVNQASTVHLTVRYSAVPDCENPRLLLSRLKNYLPVGDPNRFKVLFDQPVIITPTTIPFPGGIGTYVKAIGSTTIDVTFSHLDNSTNVYGTTAFGSSFSCNRPQRSTRRGGDWSTFAVSIPAPTVFYTVGGTVSGLTGTGLVLQNNGGDSGAVTANGAFSFATAIGVGAPYAVTVLTQPAGQTCSVLNGSGTANANVTNVAVSCAAVSAAKAWQGAALLEMLDSGEALVPQIAFDSNGNAMAVWYQVSTAGKYNIYARRYIPGSGWGAVQQVPTDPLWNNDYGSPQIAFTPSGNAIAVFTGCNPDFCEIWTSQFTAASSSWSTATQLAATGANPQIAIDTSGNAMVVWEAWNGNYNDILAMRYVASTSTWQAARGLSADIGGTGPQIAFDANGNAMAIWEMWDAANARYAVMADRYVAGSGWHPQGLPTTIASGSAGNTRRLAVDAAGNAMAVWEQFDGTANSIYSSRYSGGSWSAAALVESSANFAQRGTVSMDGSGNAIVVWSESDSGDVVSIWARRYVAGVGGTPVRIDDLSTYTSGGFPQIAMDAAGNAMAVWTQGSFTWANRYVAGTGWKGATLVDSTAAGGSSSSPQVAVDANGNAVAVWSHSGTTGPNIWGNVFK